MDTDQDELLSPQEMQRLLGGISYEGCDTERFLNFVYPTPTNGKNMAIELRVVCADGRRRSGTYTDYHKMATAARALERKYGAVATYYTLNPIAPGAISRIGAGKLNTFTGMKSWCRCATNDDILNRSLYLIDVDPDRPKDVMATREEHEAAYKVASKVRAYLTTLGWPDPIIVDSGSGYHLLYRGDQCAPISQHWEYALKIIASMFDDAAAHIDDCVHNAGRISRLPGLLNQKGVETADRRHRRAFVYEYPTEWVPLTNAQIARFAVDGGYKTPPQREASPELLLLDDDGMMQLIAEYPDQLIYTGTLDKGDDRYYLLAECPFVGRPHSDDKGRKTAIKVGVDKRTGKEYVGFSCFSSDCDGGKHKFSDLLRLLYKQTGRRPSVDIWGKGFSAADIACTWLDILPSGNAELAPESAAVPTTDEVPTAAEDVAPIRQHWLCTGDAAYDADTREAVSNMDNTRYPSDPAAWGLRQIW